MMKYKYNPFDGGKVCTSFLLLEMCSSGTCFYCKHRVHHEIANDMSHAPSNVDCCQVNSMLPCMQKPQGGTGSASGKSAK
jgi:hypothetical protein